ncbi:uncharacterized protein LOC128773859, partial [Panthera pardus]|uniref:Uncharacterized protein LOC128773859 n=1 Tax=Panthera pardus TaxID=9691 RepID=A0A9W2UN43_PANPR
YTLLSSLAPSRVWYTVLDLKDAFFSLPLAPQSQPLFAFEWHDPEEGYSGQLTWTRLPQGFKNSPTIFDEALHEDLGEYRREHPDLTLLQYVDDILIAADTAKDCERGTQDLLATLGALGYRASAKKAQICRERIHQQDTKIEQVVSACKTCQLTNARAPSNKKGTRLRGTRPGAQWEVDFTEVKPGKYGYKYLLVFTDTFSGWVEAYPTKHETAQTVAKKLLEDILPRYGFPAMVGSDNGPAFISQVTQAVAKAVGANWKLHCAYRPQSSRQVERINRTLKETLTKLTMETGGDWVTLLPYTLYRVRNTPYTLGFTPYEIMFGRPPPIIPNLRAELLAEFKDQEHFLSLRGLQRAHEDIWPRLRAIYEASPTPTPHQYRPGDWVYIKRHHRETLEPHWKGPYIVVLTTPTALKVDGIATWVHHTHVRPADPSSIRDFVTRWAISRDQHNPLKLKLQRIRPT